mmetsp:Transcript_12035/g.27018  ORF Transcript_12035/g.27018 Transcript_12035/m.27018 type:complete len:205 (-) Transcript_12035:28-642(-)
MRVIISSWVMFMNALSGGALSPTLGARRVGVRGGSSSDSRTAGGSTARPACPCPPDFPDPPVALVRAEALEAPLAEAPGPAILLLGPALGKLLGPWLGFWAAEAFVPSLGRMMSSPLSHSLVPAAPSPWSRGTALRIDVPATLRAALSEGCSARDVAEALFSASIDRICLEARAALKSVLRREAEGACALSLFAAPSSSSSSSS